MDLQDAIDAEMGWRKRELSALKANINGARLFAKDTALRSGITLLYAHWEGAIKNISLYYLLYISSLKLPYNQLKPNFLAISMKHDIEQFSETNKATVQTKIVNLLIEHHSQQSRIPTSGIISAKSNLNSETFIEIMSTLGLSTAPYESDYNLIDKVLLKMRNEIAHGEQLDAISLDEKRYNEIHSKIFSLIDKFAIQISNAANLEFYKR